jgi:hypothetical protein
MPRRNSVYRLPPEVRERVDQQIIENGWGGYQRIAEQLRSEGYHVSPSALQRYGEELRLRHEQVLLRVKFATELARALADHGQPEANPVPDAATAILQTYLFDLLMAMAQEKVDHERLQTLWRATQVLAALRRSDQMRVRTEAELKALAAQKLAMTDDEARRRGLDPETVRRLREEIYGIHEQPGNPPVSVPA